MDPCEKLRKDLQDAINERDDELSREWWYFIRVCLGIDFLDGLVAKDDWVKLLAVFEGTVTVAGIIDAITELVERIMKKEDVTDAAKVAVKKGLGKWVRRLLGIIGWLWWAWDIWSAWDDWSEKEAKIKRDFDSAVRRLYRATECPNKNAVYRDLGVPIPGA